MTENWRGVPGWEGRVQASDWGRVRNALTGALLHPTPNSKYGHLKVYVGNSKCEYVHRLVAAAFLGPGDGLEVDHINSDPSDNRLINLRYLTHAENMRATREQKPLCQRRHRIADDYYDSRSSGRMCSPCVRIRARRREACSECGRVGLQSHKYRHRKSCHEAQRFEPRSGQLIPVRLR